MASRQAAHACRRAGASAVPASMRLHAACARSRRPVRCIRTVLVDTPTRQRERACHVAVDGWLDGYVDPCVGMADGDTGATGLATRRV